MDENSNTRTPQSTVAGDDNWTPNRSEVERLAYSYHQQRGFQHGFHEDDWHRAERELRRRHTEERSNATAAGTVVGVFHDMEEARRALDKLHSAGFSPGEISVVGNTAGTADPAADLDAPPAVAAEGAEIATDAGIGAATGGLGGLLLSFAGLAIPGIGPVLAAGPVIAALAGAGVGAAAGGLIGALTERGVPGDAASHYAEGVRRGGVLVTVAATGDRAAAACGILDRYGAFDIDQQVSDWRDRGWSDHETDAPPLSPDELRREREYYGAAKRQAQEWSSQGDPTAREVRRASRIY